MVNVKEKQENIQRIVGKIRGKRSRLGKSKRQRIIGGYREKEDKRERKVMKGTIGRKAHRKQESVKLSSTSKEYFRSSNCNEIQKCYKNTAVFGVREQVKAHQRREIIRLIAFLILLQS